jgi:hypothetical protein
VAQAPRNAQRPGAVGVAPSQIPLQQSAPSSHSSPDARQKNDRAQRSSTQRAEQQLPGPAQVSPSGEQVPPMLSHALPVQMPEQQS